MFENKNSKKEDNDNKNIDNISYLSGLSFSKDIVEDINFTEKFIVFKSINDIFTLVYIDENNSIISYDLNNFKKLNEIKTEIQYNITDIKYNFDIKNKKDLIMITTYINEVQIWNINELECLTKIEINNEDGCHIYSCFCNYDNNLNIIICKKYGSKYPFMIYDLSGNKIKEINNSYEYISKMYSYYDDKLNNNYIIVTNNYINSFDLNASKEYHEYQNEIKNNAIKNIIIDNKEEIIKIIALTSSNIQIWNFNTEEKLFNIDFGLEGLNRINNISLWNSNFCLISIFHGEENSTIIKLVDLKNGKIIKNLIKYENENLISIDKISHESFGDAVLVSTNNGKIKMLIPIKN